jgi:dephospho-CoA kinase
MLAARGIAVYIADTEAKRLMSSDETLKRDIVALFGDDAYLHGELNREFLASRVFCDKEALQRLNGVVHPAVMRDFAAWAEVQEGDYVVLESAILFEAGLEGSVDATVAVMAPVELRLERAMRRDGADREKIEERMRNQLSDDERSERAKYAIVNIVLEDLEDDVEQLHRRLSYDAHRA